MRRYVACYYARCTGLLIEKGPYKKNREDAVKAFFKGHPWRDDCSSFYRLENSKVDRDKQIHRRKAA